MQKDVKQLSDTIKQQYTDQEEKMLEFEYQQQKIVVLENNAQLNENHRLELEDLCDQYASDFSKLDLQLQEKQNQIDSLKKFEKDNIILKNQLSNKDNKITELENEIKSLKQENSKIKTENKSIVDKYYHWIQSEQNNENQSQQDMKKLNKQIDLEEKQIQYLNQEIQQLQTQLQESQESANQYKYKYEKLEENLLLAQQEIEDLQYSNQQQNKYSNIRQSIQQNLAQQAKITSLDYFQNRESNLQSIKESQFSPRSSLNFANNYTTERKSTIQQLTLMRNSSFRNSNNNNQIIPKFSYQNQNLDSKSSQQSNQNQINQDTIFDSINIKDIDGHQSGKNSEKQVNWSELVQQQIKNTVRSSLIQGPQSQNKQENSDKKQKKNDKHIQFKFLQFDEYKLFEKDYLNLRETKPIKDLINKFAEDDLEDPVNLRCFSDSIFRISQDEKREKRVIFITNRSIFILHPLKNYKVQRRIPLEKLQGIIFSETSSTLFLLKVYNEYDYLIDTYRRSELNVFLIDMFKERKLKQYSIEFKHDFEIKFRDQHTQNIQSLNQQNLLKQYEGSYKDAKKLGFLSMFKSVWFGNPWVEKFIVLSQVGLLIFEAPGKTRSSLVPVSNAILVMDPHGVDRPYAIKISYNTSDQEYIFMAKSKQDQESWYDAIQHVIYESLNAKNIENESKEYNEAKNKKETQILIDL